MVNTITQKLNVPYTAKRETLMPIMRKISDAYLETRKNDPGNISQVAVHVGLEL